MKHTLKITLIILVMFLVAQFIGLFVINSYDSFFGKKAQKAVEQGELIQPEVSIIRETVPPEIELKKPVDIVRIVSVIFIAILIAFAIFLLLSRIRFTLLIKAWFALVVFICLVISLTLVLYPLLSMNLYTFLGKKIALAELIALPLALILTFYKIVKRNLIVHNFTELFIYSGLAVIFIPLLNVIAVCILLILISIYDMIAVWKTKHMIKLAKFQINHLKIFTGFFLPYLKPKDRIKIEKMKAVMKRAEKAKIKKQTKSKKKAKQKQIKVRVQIAALGGGDVAFPLIFAGTIFLAYGIAAAVITVLCTSLALLALLSASEKGKFYPAMPFLSIGCFLGLFIALLI